MLKILLLFFTIFINPFLLLSGNYYSDHQPPADNDQLDIYKDEIYRYYLFPDEKFTLTENTNNTYQGKFCLKIDPEKEERITVRLLIRNDFNLEDIWEFSELQFAIKGLEKISSMELGLEDSTAIDRRKVITVYTYTNFKTILKKKWNNIIIPVKMFPEYGKVINNQDEIEGLFDKKDCIAVNFTVHFKNLNVDNTFFLDNVIIKFDKSRVPENHRIDLVNGLENILYKYSIPERSSSVIYTNKSFMINLAAGKYAGVGLGINKTSLLLFQNEYALQFQYKAESSSMTNLVFAFVNSGRDPEKPEARINVKDYIDPGSRDWQTIVIPLTCFPAQGVYWDGEKEVFKLFKWDDIIEIKFIHQDLLQNINSILMTFFIKDLFIVKMDQKEIISQKNKLLTPIDKIIIKDKKNEGIYLGAFAKDAPENISQIYYLEQIIGKKVSQIMWYKDWSTEFPQLECEKVYEHGAVPHITWEPWLLSSTVKLKDIIQGKWDDYIIRWAKAIKKFKKKIFLRWGHEFNGNWYPWSIAKNEQDSNIYVKAYQHIHDLFTRQDVKNVLWVWCPNNFNVPDEGWNDFLKCYPGDKYVDWIGIDGYNFGTSQSFSTWQDFDTLYYNTYRKIILSSLDKPIMVAEFSCAEEGGSKADWFKDMDKVLREKYLRIKSIVFFHIKKEADWRLHSSPESAESIRTVVKNPCYLSSGENLLMEENLFPAQLNKIKDKEEKENILLTRKKSIIINKLDQYKINGSLEEWKNCKAIEINNTWSSDKKSNTPEDLSGKAYFAYNRNDLLFAFEIFDDTPLNNPYEKGDIWKGDGIELALGLPGQKERGQFSTDDFQIGISPGSKDIAPLIWMWKKDKEILNKELAVKSTGNGYVIEGKISFTDFNNYSVKKNDVLDFNMAVNDLDEGLVRDIHLIWNGTDGYHLDPSLWGKAVIGE